MSTLSVPLTKHLEEHLERLIENGLGENKASIMRKALERFIEDEAVYQVLRAEQEVKEGKILKGDIDELASV